MSSDLHLSSSQFEWLLRAFYITYICFEWMTLLWKVLPAHVYCMCIASNLASVNALTVDQWPLAYVHGGL